MHLWLFLKHTYIFRSQKFFFFQTCLNAQYGTHKIKQHIFVTKKNNVTCDVKIKFLIIFTMISNLKYLKYLKQTL